MTGTFVSPVDAGIVIGWWPGCGSADRRDLTVKRPPRSVLCEVNSGQISGLPHEPQCELRSRVLACHGVSILSRASVGVVASVDMSNELGNKMRCLCLSGDYRVMVKPKRN